MHTTVWITAEFVDFHQWLNAPDSVGYLRWLHRHLFKVRVEVFVGHNDRDVEFHTLKADVETAIIKLRSRLELARSFSCETMAEHIAWELASKKYEPANVEVSEDGECGAIIRFQPKDLTSRIQKGA